MNVNGPEKGAGSTAIDPTPSQPGNGKVVTNQTKKTVDTIGSMIERLKPELAKALPKHITPERLARTALTAIRQNKKLMECEAVSLMGSIMVSAQLGLEPNTPLGQSYIIPYGNQAQFQIGYKGLIELAHRSGQYKRIDAFAVDEADQFEYSYGLEEKLIHIPSDKPTGKTKYFYALYELSNGGRSYKVWGREKIEAHGKKYSKSFNKAESPWQTNFDSMALKTCLIDVLKFAPKSVEVAQAVAADGAVHRVNPEDPDLTIDFTPEYELMG